jgi:hypothetical protein
MKSIFKNYFLSMHGERQTNNYDIFWTRHTPNTFIPKKFIGSSDISNFLKFGIEGGQGQGKL